MERGCCLLDAQRSLAQHTASGRLDKSAISISILYFIIYRGLLCNNGTFVGPDPSRMSLLGLF